MAKRAKSKPGRRMTRTSMKRTKGGGTGSGATGALLNSTGENTWLGGHNTGALRNVSNSNT